MTAVADADGVAIAYEVHDRAGRSAPWAVFVHGLGYGRWGWEPVIELLAAQCNLVLLDNRGTGESGSPPGPYDAATMAGDVAVVMDHLALDYANVVGTSLGGMIAQELAIERPERVDRLVLVGTTPGGEASEPTPETTRKLLAAAPQMAPTEALRALTANALSASARERDPTLLDRIIARRAAHPQDPAGWQAQAAAGTTFDAGGRGERIAAPTLVVHGTDDAVVAPRNGELLTARIPGATLESVEGGGHLLFWEQPARFAEVIAGFFCQGYGDAGVEGLVGGPSA